MPMFEIVNHNSVYLPSLAFAFIQDWVRLASEGNTMPFGVIRV
jgi:hypothetical protein